MQPVDCPDASDLELLLLGLVPRPYSEQLAEHLESCATCNEHQH